MTRTLLVPTLLAAVVVAAAGCGGSSEGTSDDGAPASGAAIPGGGLSVEDALSTSAEGPLLVAGYLIETDGRFRLCEAILESFPPQCGEPSLEIQGHVDESQAGERVSLIGDVEDGVLTISETTQG